MIKDGIIYDRYPLSEEEKKMNLYKYWERPLHELNPFYKLGIDFGPMDQKYTIRPDRLIDSYMMPGHYPERTIGWCKYPEGGYFLRHYQIYPGATFEMLKWYYTWINVPFKNQPEGTGNIKYKIWNPAGHWTHDFINKKDRSGGVLNCERLDLLQRPETENADPEHPGTQYGDSFISIRYPIDLEAFGMTKEMKQAYTDAGCWMDPSVVKYFVPKDYFEKGIWTPIPGSQIMMTMSRPCPIGGIEKMSCEWIGWDIKDGKLVRDESALWKETDEWIHIGITHAHTEAQHLSEFLPELYAEYHDKPFDCED